MEKILTNYTKEKDKYVAITEAAIKKKREEEQKKNYRVNRKASMILMQKK